MRYHCPNMFNLSSFCCSNTNTSPTCFGHRMTIFSRRPNIKGEFITCAHKRCTHVSNLEVLIIFINIYIDVTLMFVDVGSWRIKSYQISALSCSAMYYRRVLVFCNVHMILSGIILLVPRRSIIGQSNTCACHFNGS